MGGCRLDRCPGRSREYRRIVECATGSSYHARRRPTPARGSGDVLGLQMQLRAQALYAHVWSLGRVLRRPERPIVGHYERSSQLEAAKAGDTILAYQTDRNELVGIARVVGWKPDGKYKRLILRPVATIGVRVRPLKEMNPQVARIPALQPGPIRTLYHIDPADAKALVNSAGVRLKLGAQDSARLRQSGLGAGFGDSEQDRRVERAALRFVRREYERFGYSVRDVSPENRGYDLLCRRRGDEKHVEVKGARAEGQRFVITANELAAWEQDKRFVLALVVRALSKRPSVHYFPAGAGRNEFVFRPLAYIATRNPDRATRAKARNRQGRRFA